MDSFQSQILISLMCFSVSHGDSFTNYGPPAGWNGYNNWNTYQDAFGNRVSSNVDNFNQQQQRRRFGFYDDNNALNMAQSMANKQREAQLKMAEEQREAQLKMAEKQRENQQKENERRLKMAGKEREARLKMAEKQRENQQKENERRLKMAEKERERLQKQAERSREFAQRQAELEQAKMAQYYANYYNQGYPMQPWSSPSSYFPQVTPNVAANPSPFLASPPSFLANPPPPPPSDNDNYNLYDDTRISTITTNGVTYRGTTRDLCRRKLLTCKDGNTYF